ncbi:MAG: hypothetical protein HC893_02645, partial [Chloroflexaceae bacterium]|nr:hypothetical protein [Chloroflexaceae bacterium]
TCGAEQRPCCPRTRSGCPGSRSGCPAADYGAALLAVVSDKTGYPVEMLDHAMDLEADLGIDSIKRVEILGTLQEQFPGPAHPRARRPGRTAHPRPDCRPPRPHQRQHWQRQRSGEQR